MIKFKFSDLNAKNIATKEKRIFFDVTLLTLVTKKNGGITRICIEFCRWFLENQLLEIEFVYFDFKVNNFLIMDKWTLAKKINDLNLGTYENTRFAKLKHQFRDCFLMSVNSKSESASFDRCGCFFDAGLNLSSMRYNKLLNLKKSYQFKLVTICYDLIPLFCPFFGLNEFVLNVCPPYFRFLFTCSDCIFSISNYTAKDMQRFASLNNITLPLVSIIKEFGTNMSKSSSRKSNNSLSKKFINEDFLLCVCSIEKRKNHEVLYKAYLYLLEQGFKDLPKMIFCGSIDLSLQDFVKTIRCHPEVKDYIILLENINDSDLEKLYSDCLFTLYPSFYEGFGLPLVESLAQGKFCISSDATSLPEVGKNYVDYVHPLDVIGWAEKILFYVKHREELSKREQFIKENYISPTWNDCISTIYNEISRLM